ncbi:MAG: hypothetical protein QOG08_709, partial [Chloroflexota bacterium]|nr:hypothetical protein [Chloroflexota bacterium]
HISRIPEVVRYAGVAAGVALLLALGYLVLMEFLQPAGTAVASGADWREAIIPGWGRRARVGAAVPAISSGSGPAAPDPPPLNGSGTAKKR